MRDTRHHVLLAIELKMSSSESRQGETRQGRQLTDREKQALLEVLTRAGLPHLKDAFLREKVRIVIIFVMCKSMSATELKMALL